jgi:hypothetical protein
MSLRRALFWLFTSLAVFTLVAGTVSFNWLGCALCAPQGFVFISDWRVDYFNLRPHNIRDTNLPSSGWWWQDWGVCCFRPSNPSKPWTARAADALSLPRYTPSSVIMYSAPLWPMFVLAIAAAVLARGPRRRDGTCRSCGYDLRASPKRCPECGEAVRPLSQPPG